MKCPNCNTEIWPKDTIGDITTYICPDCGKKFIKNPRIENDVPECNLSAFRREAAMSAMQALIGLQLGYKPSPEQIAEYSVCYADALIEELKK